jgi:hypothetical protein
MLDEGVSTGQLVLHKTKPEQIVRSQAGGVRHKREGLAYRLSVDESNNKWHPPKRVMASTRLRKRRQKMYTLRAELAAASHKAFNDAKKSKNPMIFKNQMQGLIDSYQASKVSTIKAVRRKFVAALTRMFHPVALKRK